MTEVICPMCNKPNKDYDSIFIKCWNCDHKIYKEESLPDNWDMTLSGKRIQLIHTNDPYTDLKEGDLGTIEYVMKHETIEDQISIQWDNGSTLMMLVGIDEYIILDEVDQTA